MSAKTFLSMGPNPSAVGSIRFAIPSRPAMSCALGSAQLPRLRFETRSVWSPPPAEDAEDATTIAILKTLLTHDFSLRESSQRA
ncbi:MAG TPA: hypothetical protein VMS56_13215, partial [Thermoanaerobaculia bacterium]|nr:hypothetical protein [Thermoanaerobaculia bacterium]